MPLRYLDGEDQLSLWLTEERHGWMTKLDPIEFSDEELAEIERIEEAYSELQQMLSDRFGYSRILRMTAALAGGVRDEPQ